MGGEHIGVNNWAIQWICNKQIRTQGYKDFAWQSRLYDHIIRSEDSIHKARIYIASNPMNWDQDRDNVAGVDM
jgi:nucleoside-specific outer membrane channel protein Tsx